MPQKAYARAGVDIDLANRLKSRLGKRLKAQPKGTTLPADQAGPVRPASP